MLNLNQLLRFARSKSGKVHNDGDLPVVQIGIGGIPGSGKTLLIDALARLVCMHHKSAFGRITLKAGDGVHESLAYLRRGFRSLKVDVPYDVQGTKRIANWNDNTYVGRLHWGGSDKILLIKNIPGEMFMEYYQARSITGGDVETLADLFVRYCATKEISVGHSFHLGGYDQQKFEDLRKDFFLFIESVEPKSEEKPAPKPESKGDSAENTVGKGNESGAARDTAQLDDLKGENSKLRDAKSLFFSFLFYHTSQFNIYCIPAVDGLSEETDLIRAHEIDQWHMHAASRVSKGAQHILCVTQMDKLFTRPEVFGAGKRNYWEKMESFYKDYKDSTGVFAGNGKRDDDDDLLAKLKASLHSFKGAPVFFTSVSYNTRKDRFFKFPNDIHSKATDEWSRAEWPHRSASGVLELLVYLVGKMGFDTKMSTVIHTDQTFAKAVSEGRHDL
jgi:hypothetical protein